MKIKVIDYQKERDLWLKKIKNDKLIHHTLVTVSPYENRDLMSKENKQALVDFLNDGFKIISAVATRDAVQYVLEKK